MLTYNLVHGNMRCDQIKLRYTPKKCVNIKKMVWKNMQRIFLFDLKCLIKIKQQSSKSLSGTQIYENIGK